MICSPTAATINREPLRISPAWNGGLRRAILSGLSSSWKRLKGGGAVLVVPQRLDALRLVLHGAVGSGAFTCPQSTPHNGKSSIDKKYIFIIFVATEKKTNFLK